MELWGVPVHWAKLSLRDQIQISQSLAGDLHPWTLISTFKKHEMSINGDLYKAVFEGTFESVGCLQRKPTGHRLTLQCIESSAC